ncbi:MAG TPA: BON domain-containing protein [Thermoleophilia bacterium]|nr:BON domain-containing protein [Thermoleophilia bacterium]
MALLVAAAILGAAVLAGCGDGGNPAPIADTLTPAPGLSTVPASPTGSAVASPSPTGTSGASTLSPAPGQTPSGQTSTTIPSPSPSTSAGTITDKSIRADIRRRLAASPVLVGLEFKVFVHKRVVVLAGTVKTKVQKTTAEQIAVTEPGVKKVVSYVTVVPGGGGY